MDKDTNFKFGMWVDEEAIQKFAKLGQIGTCPGLRDYLLHFDFFYTRNGCGY